MDYKKIQHEVIKFYKKATSPSSTQELTEFLETLPEKTGRYVLIAGGIAWGFAAISILYGTVQAERIAELKKEMSTAQAVVPPVPTVTNVSIDKNSIETFTKKAAEEYRDNGVNITEKNGKIEIIATSGRQYGVFREAVGHIQNGGQGWRVSVEELCVGRGCLKSQKGAKSFLYGLFSVSRVNIDMPRI